MQPVQFHCDYCGRLMAVSSEHVGKQVRCPHCQQVVVAPVTTTPSGPAISPFEASAPGFPETVLNVPTSPGDAEDIFSPHEASDDLFSGGEAPRIELPPLEPLAPKRDEDLVDTSQQPEIPLPSNLPWLPTTAEPSATAASPFTPLGPSSNTDLLPGNAPPAWTPGTITDTLTLPLPEVPLVPPSEPPPSIVRGRGRTEARVPWFMLLVFSPLLLYAIFITIFAILLYRQEQDVRQQLRHRFEMMPDEGDKPGVQKAKQISLWRYEPKTTTLPLPEHLCTTLGQPLQIGDLEVTPVRVERKRVKVIVETKNPEPCVGDSLVLYLRMKNVSSAVAFAPLDNYFDRHWKGGAQPPFTLLEVGKHRFHGGPADWHPLGDRYNFREWVEGRGNLPDVLQPGEEKELFVCTDGNDASAEAVLFGGASPAYHGSFLWRVRVRRGLVRFQDKDYSATAVLGVRFTDKDISPSVPQAG